MKMGGGREKKYFAARENFFADGTWRRAPTLYKRKSEPPRFINAGRFFNAYKQAARASLLYSQPMKMGG